MREPGAGVLFETNMAINFKLPSFTTPVEVWKLQPDHASWVKMDDDLTGQLYTAKRHGDDEEESSTYFVYPKEDDVLLDRIDYGGIANSDVVVIAFPTGAARRVGYRVREVQPRWLRFSNEHLQATLQKLTPAELNGVETNVPPPAPPPFWTSCMIWSSPGEVPADGTSFNTLCVHLADNLGHDIVGQDVTFLTTGSVVLADATQTTNYWGQACTTATNTVEEITQFRVDVTGFGQLPMYNEMTWTEAAPPPPPPATPDYDLSTIVAIGSPLAVDGTAQLKITMLDATSTPIAGLDVVPEGLPFGTYILTPSTGLTTDVNGEALWDVTDSVAETVVFTGHDITNSADITTTADVEWEDITPPALPTTWQLDVTSCTNNTCPACGDLNGTLNLTETITDTEWMSALIAGGWTCASSGSAQWKLTVSGDDVNLYVMDEVIGTFPDPYLRLTGSLAGWNETDPIVLTVVDDGGCNWSGAVAITPL